MKRLILAFVSVALLLCVSSVSPAVSAPAPTNPGFKWTVTLHVGGASSQAVDIYTSSDAQDAEYYVKLLQALGYDKDSDFSQIRDTLHITAITVVAVMNLPPNYVQFPSVIDVINMGQISLAFID